MDILLDIQCILKNDTSTFAVGGARETSVADVFLALVSTTQEIQGSS